ncbi:MAG: CotH kinase family protein [Candidatus Sabulitectum sp.]|nr:CotH kinase family protein [Candidatus Sabulitectum sp.]
MQENSFALEEYFLAIAPEHLDSLYADPWSSNEYPAVISCSSGTADCFVRFRGKSTLSFPKKSWAIIFPDHSFLGRKRLNLNSEYMDPGMMRNFIAMRTSELMGFPASRTSYAKLFVNGEYEGVYLDIERVDSLYFQRYGLFPQVVFKAQMEGARFMQLPSGVSQLQAYRPRGDGELFVSRLENFIDCLHAGVEPLPVDVDNLLGYYAVNLALVEKDSGSNNYYLTLGSDGKWRVFPWDRGSCLGSLSSGEFLPELVDDTSLRYFRENSLYQRLVLSPANMQTFELYMNQATALLSNEIPLLLDSIYNQIRFDLYDDPLSQWTPEEIDQAYEDLVWFVANRAEFLSENMLVPETASVLELDISDPWLDVGEEADITIWISNPFETARLKWLTGSEGHFLSMIPVNGFEGLKWTISFLMTDEVDHCPLSFLFNTSTGDRQYFYYPPYGLATHAYMQSAHPCIVRPAPGSSIPGDSGNCNFSVLVPRVYGPALWALPLVNESGVDVDVSCCVFVFGDSPNRIFLPPGTVAGAGDTLFLTNSISFFQAEFPFRTAFGNCASSAPGSGTLTMLDPGWGQLWTMPVPAGIEEHLASSPLMVTEINCMPSEEYNCGDWVEFYNPGDTIIDIGGFSLRDSEGNRCIVPMNTVVEPDGFRVLVREQYLFQSCFSGCDVSVSGLGFGLDS